MGCGVVSRPLRGIATIPSDGPCCCRQIANKKELTTPSTIGSPEALSKLAYHKETAPAAVIKTLIKISPQITWSPSEQRCHPSVSDDLCVFF